MAVGSDFGEKRVAQELARGEALVCGRRVPVPGLLRAAAEPLGRSVATKVACWDRGEALEDGSLK